MVLPLLSVKVGGIMMGLIACRRAARTSVGRMLVMGEEWMWVERDGLGERRMRKRCLS